MPDNHSWPESTKSWGLGSYPESLRTVGQRIPKNMISMRTKLRMNSHFPNQKEDLSLSQKWQLMYVHCDRDGNEYLPLKQLFDYQKDAKMISLRPTTSAHGRSAACKSTTETNLLPVKKLSNLKESYPLPIAKFTIVQGIDHVFFF